MQTLSEGFPWALALRKINWAYRERTDVLSLTSR